MYHQGYWWLKTAIAAQQSLVAFVWFYRLMSAVQSVDFKLQTLETGAEDILRFRKVGQNMTFLGICFIPVEYPISRNTNGILFYGA